MIPVRTAPTSTPRMGLVNSRNMLVNHSSSFRPLTAPDMVSMPNIRTAKPSRIIPISFFLLSLRNL